MKKIIFVSTGRCGTKRLYEILKTKELDAVVKHQMPILRIANIIGNIMFSLKESDKIKSKLYDCIISKNKYKKYFFCTDPLTSMIIPEKIIHDPDTMIVHLLRPEDEVAASFYKISRKRLKSFIAHNIIPYWQIRLLPFENIINRKIIDKYKEVCVMKNIFFCERYSLNPNYKKLFMQEVFSTDILTKILKKFLNEDVLFSSNEMSIKSNR